MVVDVSFLTSLKTNKTVKQVAGLEIVFFVSGQLAKGQKRTPVGIQW